MKRILLSLLFIIAGTGIISAQQSEGVIRYLVTHNWVKKMAAVDYLSQEKKDRASYMWGNDAEWTMYGTLYFNGQKTKYEDSEEKANADYEGYSWRKDEYFIYRDLAQRRMQDIIKLLGKVYIIEDTLISQEWKILNDLKEVAGHICMNASWTDTVKSQKVIAWFALDIPLSAGPERFCGLPGLILEIDINNGALVLTADKIEYTSVVDHLDFPKKLKGKHLTEIDYQTILYKHILGRKAEEQPYFWGIRY